ncbi:ABC transporter ATP-binding protein [Streptomyces sp. NPDC057236]|uniref:ABC transporter ATP-binding protein n=1 Tax=Streptomyces sp. NPDC057236 TaxID=3346059 RepID=UPI00362E3466
MDKTDFGDDDGDGVPPWTEDRLEEPGAGRPVLCDETDGIGFGAVADTGPDVIPASCSGPTEQDCETLGRIALLVPRAGRVVLDGEEVHRTPARELARALGPLPRSPVTPEGITVLDLVGRGHHPHQRAFSRWTAQDDAALEATRTTEPAERAVDELSGGRRQRVWIAMAPAQQTDLLLDGPTTFLDISHRIEVLDLPSDLNRTRGATIGMVPHDLDPAARYADRLMALASGRLHAAGTPEEVMTEDTVRAVYGMESRVIEDPVPGGPLLPPIGRHHSTATDAEAAAASSQHAAGSR